jgi:hypothetical protein
MLKKIKKHKLKDIICIDETSINALQKRHHCYNDVGKICVITTRSHEVYKYLMYDVIKLTFDDFSSKLDLIDNLYF